MLFLPLTILDFFYIVTHIDVNELKKVGSLIVVLDKNDYTSLLLSPGSGIWGSMK